MQAVAPAAAGHEPPGELVDDHHLAVLHHVIDVALVQRVRAERLIDVMQKRHVGRVVEAAWLEPVPEHLLGLRHAAFGQRHRLVLLVDEIIARRFERLALFRFGVAARHGAGLEARNDAVDFVIEIGRLFGWTRNDERGPRLVDEDAVHLVNDREVMSALDVVRELELHVVAQVVEAELVVGSVRDVGRIGDLPLRVDQVVLDDADRHAEETVDPAHPFRVAAGEVIVHRDDVNAFAVERVQVGWQRGDERLALAGFHLGDLAFVQDGSADQLHVEVPHVEHAAAGIADDGERLRQQVVQRLAVGEPLAELGGLPAKPIVGQRRDRGLEGIHFGHDWTQTFELPIVLGADDFGEQGIEHLRLG